MIRAVLFDMDGTLLPMDTDAFTDGYFALLGKKASEHGCEPQAFCRNVWAGTRQMILNDGSRTNEQVFREAFRGFYGDRTDELMNVFDRFYENEFGGTQVYCSMNPEAAKAVEAIRAMGYRTSVATNPLFPAVAILRRLSWAGLTPDGFEVITAYEDSHFCKPSPAYFTEVAQRMGLRADECLMVGNDLTEDGAAAKAGMRVFIIDDCLLNKQGLEPDSFPHGGFPDLVDYVRALGRS